MDPFVIRVIVSFVVGGALIALFSLIAEKYPRVGGVIIALPSTLVVSFVFIGLTQSATAASHAAIATLANLGPATLCLAGLIRVQKGGRPISDILFGLTAGIIIWLVPAVVLVRIGVPNVMIAVMVFTLFLFPAAYFLRQKTDVKAPPVGRYSFAHKLTRACVGGALIALSVWLAKTAGSTVGGVIASFPVVITTTILFIRSQRPVESIRIIGKRLPDGMALLAGFTVLVIYSYPAFGVGWGTVFSLAITVLLSFLRILIVQRS